MMGLAGLGVADNWSIEIDETDSAWGLRIQHPSLCAQLAIDNPKTLHDLWSLVAKPGEDFVDVKLGDIFDAVLTVSVFEERMRFRIKRLAGGRYTSLFDVYLNEKIERAKFGYAIRMALDDLE